MFCALIGKDAKGRNPASQHFQVGTISITQKMLECMTKTASWKAFFLSFFILCDVKNVFFCVVVLRLRTEVFYFVLFVKLSLKWISVRTEDGYAELVRRVINEHALFQWLDEQQEVASVADCGWRPAECNLSHSSVPMLLQMDYFLDVDLAPSFLRRHSKKILRFSVIFVTNSLNVKISISLVSLLLEEPAFDVGLDDFQNPECQILDCDEQHRPQGGGVLWLHQIKHQSATWGFKVECCHWMCSSGRV